MSKERINAMLTKGHRIRLSLINDERKTGRVLSAKACGAIFIDLYFCSEGAVDTCDLRDYSGCSGPNALDYCKYTDEESCVGTSAFDSCGFDYDYGHNCGFYDYCENVDG